MGSKDKGKREAKKKPKPKPAPAHKREDFSQAAARIVREATKGD